MPLNERNERRARQQEQCWRDYDYLISLVQGGVSIEKLNDVGGYLLAGRLEVSIPWRRYRDRSQPDAQIERYARLESLIKRHRLRVIARGAQDDWAKQCLNPDTPKPEPAANTHPNERMAATLQRCADTGMALVEIGQELLRFSNEQGGNTNANRNEPRVVE